MTARKKTVSSKQTGRGKSGATTPKSGANNSGTKSGGTSGSPYFVLIILILITIILVMFNNFKDNKDFISGNFKGEVLFKDDKNVKKNPAAKTSKTSKTEKVADKSKENSELPSEKDKLVSESFIYSRVFFLKLNEKTEKLYIASVKRKISEDNYLNGALKALIEGPSPYESRKGYISAVPKNLKIRAVKIIGEQAEIDFDGLIEKGAVGEILLKRIKQIVYTATEFKKIKSITLKVNGRKRKTIGVDGLFTGGPLRR